MSSALRLSLGAKVPSSLLGLRDPPPSPVGAGRPSILAFFSDPLWAGRWPWNFLSAFGGCQPGWGAAWTLGWPLAQGSVRECGWFSGAMPPTHEYTREHQTPQPFSRVGEET